MKLYNLKALSFITAFLVSMTMPCMAQEEWQLTVLNQPEQVISSELTQANKSITNILTEQLIAGNFEVTDLSALSIKPDISDQELAQKYQQSINLALRYHIHLTKAKGPAVTKWTLHLSAYLVDLDTKKRIESHQDKISFANSPNDCQDSCFADWLALKATVLAQDTGAVFVEKLSSLPRRFRYQLEFNDFSGDELDAIRQHLNTEEGTIFVTLLKRKQSKQQLFHQVEGASFRYVSEMSADQLDSRLSKKLTLLGVPTLSQSNNGRQFAFKRSYIPYLLIYMIALSVILIVTYCVYVKVKLSQHGQILSQHLHKNEQSQWLAHFKGNPLFGIKRPVSWFEQQKQSLDAIKQSTNLSEQAWLLTDQGDYNQAQLKVTEAIQLNTDNKKANELKDNIVDYQRGYQRLIKAESEFINHPEQALILLQEAIALNPHLKEKIDKLSIQSQKIIIEQTTKNTISEVNNALSHSEHYLALSHIDNAVKSLDPNIGSEQISLLKNLRNKVLNELKPISGSVLTTGELANCKLYPNSQLSIGRKVEDNAQGFAIQYKRISRGGKQNIISRQGNSFYVKDQGSANGSCYDAVPLVTNQQVKLENDKVLALGGVNGQPGICKINTCLSNDKSKSLVLMLNKDAVQFIDDTGIGTAWPTLDADLDTRWIMMGDSLNIAITSDSALDFGAVSGGKIVATLHYTNGYYIAGANDKDNLVMANQQPIHGLVPITEKTTITICGSSFGFTPLLNSFAEHV
jgi:tetratricopeptide (TPR) repeat protein